MGLLDRMFAPTRVEKRGLSLEDAGQWAELGLLNTSSAGVSVSVEGSLRYGAVFACVRVLSQTMASLPLVVYERLERGKQRAPGHPLYRLLHTEPNPLMTSFELRQALMGHLALWGNAYCEVELDGAGRVTALWPLRPDKMVEINRTGEGLSYVYELPSGRRVTLPEWRVFHVRGLSSDGVMGYSPIGTARQAVGLGLAAEEFGARFFGNDARPGGVLQHPGVLGDTAHGRLQKSWESRHGGLAKSHRVAILEEGMTYQQIGIPPEDAQFLETRKFQAEEIARIFGVPAHKIGLLDRATFSNIEHQSIEFVTDTVRPYAVQWEQAINLRLMSRRDQERFFAEFLVDGLLRGDTVSRYQAYATGRQNGWLSANDIRELENMNPVEGGDVYLVPLNMVAAGGQESASGQLSVGSEEVAMNRHTTNTANGEMRRLANGAEIRAEQWDAAGARHRLQVAYLPLYEDVVARIVKRETNDIGNAARRLLKKEQISEFQEWLRRFWQEHVGFVTRQYGPLVKSYAAQIAEMVAREVGSDETPEAESFQEAYTEKAAERHVARQRAKLRNLIEAELANGLQESGNAGPTVLAAIEEMLTDWEETQPGVVAREESVRANNALALSFYRVMGKSKKTWVTFGENCPYCSSLGGRTIEIDVPFLSRGQDFFPEGAAEPLITGKDIGHAPAHGGCDCMTVAG